MYNTIHLNNNKILAEYVWQSDKGLKSKSRTLEKKIQNLDDLPNWQYAGGSGQQSEFILVPRAVFRDPFRTERDILVFCDRYLGNGEPHPLNTRAPALEIFRQCKDQHPAFGIEQEYVMTRDGTTPLGFPGTENISRAVPRPEGPHYCGVGYTNVHGRLLAEEHYRYCINAGVKIEGINAELLHGQWEFQVGLCEGIEAGDHLWVARYILERLGEAHGIIISYDPKPVPGKEWSASGLHTNFSTLKMRENEGYQHIIDGIEKLRSHHITHLKLFGEGNERRLDPKTIEEFTYGVADRSASVRISQEVFDNKKGYFEDRRPASNADPYIVTSNLAKVICLSDLKRKHSDLEVQETESTKRGEFVLVEDRRVEV